MSEETLPTLSGPAAVAVSVRLGIRGRARPTVVDVALVNIGDDPVPIQRITCDPVQLAESGAAAAGSITAAWRRPAGGGDATLPPGDTIVLGLTVDPPRQAGAYASTLRIRTAPGSAMNIPITLQVGANPIWGITAMLAGLMLLGLVNVLAGEADLRDELHKILQFRQDANEELERNPPPESQSDNLALFDANIRQAVQSLTMPRQWSIADHRIDESRDRKRVAEDELREIEESVAKSPAGAAQVAELDREWDRLQQKMTELTARAAPVPEQSSGNFAGRVATLVANFDKNLLELPLQIDRVELGTHVELVDLALSAGRRDDADRSALEVRRWLQRDATDIENRLNAAARVGTVAGFLIGEEARARQRLADPVVNGDTQRALAKELDAAIGPLSAASSCPI